MFLSNSLKIQHEHVHGFASVEQERHTYDAVLETLVANVRQYDNVLTITALVFAFSADLAARFAKNNSFSSDKYMYLFHLWITICIGTSLYTLLTIVYFIYQIYRYIGSNNLFYATKYYQYTSVIRDKYVKLSFIICIVSLIFSLFVLFFDGLTTQLSYIESFIMLCFVLIFLRFLHSNLTRLNNDSGKCRLEGPGSAQTNIAMKPRSGIHSISLKINKITPWYSNVVGICTDEFNVQISNENRNTNWWNNNYYCGWPSKQDTIRFPNGVLCGYRKQSQNIFYQAINFMRHRRIATEFDIYYNASDSSEKDFFDTKLPSFNRNDIVTMIYDSDKFILSFKKNNSKIINWKIVNLPQQNLYWMIGTYLGEMEVEIVQYNSDKTQHDKVISLENKILFNTNMSQNVLEPT